MAVARELHVELDHAGADVDRAAERGQGVLGVRAAGSAMGDHQTTHALPHKGRITSRQPIHLAYDATW